ncbi:hypothetical protein P3S67_025885 [Capsicum chacoense]
MSTQNHKNILSLILFLQLILSNMAKKPSSMDRQKIKIAKIEVKNHLQSLIDRFLSRNNNKNNPIANNSLQLVEAHRNANVCGLNLQLTQILGEVEIEKKRGESLDQMRKTIQSQCWWEAPISQLDLQELEQLKDSMEALKKHVTNHASKFMVDEISNSSTFFGWDQVAVNNSLVLMSSTRLELCQEVQYNGVGWLTLGRSLGLGARFGVYEILTALYKDQISHVDVGPLSPLAVSLAAGFSGSLAAAASHGFDTAKSRSQCMVPPKDELVSDKFLWSIQLIGLGVGMVNSTYRPWSWNCQFNLSALELECMYPWRGFVKWQLPGKRFESWTGIHPADRNILFRGLRLRMARSGIASSVVVGGYLFAIDKLLS